MIDILMLLACVLTRPFRSRAQLEADILVLRHQHLAAQIDRKSGLQKHRSLGVCWAVSSCAWRGGCPKNFQTGDGDPLAAAFPL